MRLEMGTFPVKNIVFGSKTRWDDGVLELNADELLAPILAEPSIESAMLEIGKPGESTRIINYYDILEPRIKVEGSAMTYPGRVGRPADTVGSGRTHRLGGMTIMTCVDRWPRRHEPEPNSSTSTRMATNWRACFGS